MTDAPQLLNGPTASGHQLTEALDRWRRAANKAYACGPLAFVAWGRPPFPNDDQKVPPSGRRYWLMDHDLRPAPRQVRFVARLTARGCITLSPEVREVLDLHGGDLLELEVRPAPLVPSHPDQNDS